MLHFSFSDILNVFGVMLTQRQRNEEFHDGKKNLTIAIKNKKWLSMNNNLDLSVALMRFKDSKVSVSAIYIPQLRKGIEIRSKAGSFFPSTFFRNEIPLFLKPTVLHGVRDQVSERNGDGKTPEKSEVVMEDAPLRTQDDGSQTEEPLYVMPDCSVFWKSEQDKMDLLSLGVQQPKQSTPNDGFSEVTAKLAQLWKPVEDEGFEDLWQCCSEDYLNLASKKNIEDWESDSGFCEDLPLSTKRICFCCEVVIEKSKFNYQRRYGLLNNCDHVFCYPCIQKVWKPTCNPLIKSAVCPKCGKKSEAVATNLVWKEGEEKYKFFHDFFDACRSRNNLE